MPSNEQETYLEKQLVKPQITRSITDNLALIKIYNNLAQRAFIIEQSTMKQLKKLDQIFTNTNSSDKFVRLAGSIIKILKNFNLLKAQKVDKLLLQIGNLRRLLRLNRSSLIIKEWIKFFQTKGQNSRDIFNNCFKIIMFISDIADTILYLMQHKVLKKSNWSVLQKIVADFYFYECVIWFVIHIYEYLRDRKFKSQQYNRNEELIIIKYLLDIITSHNDWSRRCSTLNIKTISVISIMSSLLGVFMVWK